MEFTISATERERLCWVAKAAGTDKTRPHLNGLMLDGSGEKWKAVATDSYRLHETTFDADAPAREGLFGWINLDHLKVIGKVKDNAPMVIEVADYGVSVAGQISPPLTGQFPDCSQLWPDAFEHEVPMDVPAFTVKDNPRSRNIPGKVRVTDGVGEFLLSRNSMEGDIGVNPMFLIDAVGGRAETTLRTISPFKPMLFIRENERALVMPVKLAR